jgi:hypothetical protein
MLPISKKNNTRKKVCFGALSIKYYFFMSRISKLQETQASGSFLSTLYSDFLCDS